MPDRQSDVDGPHSSSARHVSGGEIREANKLWELDYNDDDRWVCIDDDCTAEMTPYCWKWCEKQNCFVTKAGLPAKQPPHFRAEEGHSTNCNASRRAVQRDQTHPEYRLGIPTDYPARVKFFRERSGASRSNLRTPDDAPGPDDSDRRRARSIYRIREACEYYADNPGEHGRRLRVELCSGSTYQQCFVRLGTGEHGNVGKAWIFYDQIWFTDFINLRAGTETFELPLLTTVHGEPRKLIVRTSKWLPRHREEFRQRLLVAIRGAKAALAEKRPERPWIFFHGSEAVFNQLEFEADLQPGVDVLMRDLPWTWNLRLWNGYRRGKRRQPFQDRAALDWPPNNAIAVHAEQPGSGVPLVPDASMPLSADKHGEPEVLALDVGGGDRPNAPGGRFASVGGEEAGLLDVRPSNSIGAQLVVMPQSPELHEVDTHDRPLRSPATGAAETVPTDEPTPEKEPEKAGEPLHALSPAAINQAEAAEALSADAERGSDVAGPQLEPLQKKLPGKLGRLLAMLIPWRRSDTS